MKNIILWIALVLTQVSCGKILGSGTATDIQETAQQVGDAMASVDESSGRSSGVLSMVEDTHAKLFARLEKSPFIFSNQWTLFPKAVATSCALASTFGSCTGAGQIVRTFGDCTVGSATFSGTVTLSWGNGAACALSGVSDTITRVPSFTVTGRRGATLTVTKTGSVGQRLTWMSGAGANKVFQFSNDGIRRVFTAPSSEVLFDFTTETTSPITVTGAFRNSNRTMNGGALRVTHNLSGVTCDYTPTSVQWSSTCNCAVSGSWSATCSDGKSSTLTLTGCGTADFTMGTATQSVTFDRCYGI